MFQYSLVTRTTKEQFSVIIIPSFGQTSQYQLVLDQYGLNAYYTGARAYAAFSLHALVRHLFENIILAIVHWLFPVRRLSYYVFWRDVATISIDHKRRWWRTGATPNRGTLQVVEKSGKKSPLFILHRKTNPVALEAAINQYRDKSGSYGAQSELPAPLANWNMYG